MKTSLLPAEQGTRTLFGKPYHWHLVDGVLSLHAGTTKACVEASVPPGFPVEVIEP